MVARVVATKTVAQRVGPFLISYFDGAAARTATGWVASSAVLVENATDRAFPVDPEMFSVAEGFVPEPAGTTLRPLLLRPGEAVRARLTWRGPALLERPKYLDVAVRTGTRPDGLGILRVPFSRPLARAGWIAAGEALDRQRRERSAVIRYGDAYAGYGGPSGRLMRLDVTVENPTQTPQSIARSGFTVRVAGARASPFALEAKPGVSLPYSCSVRAPGLPDTVSLQPGERETYSLCFPLPTLQPAAESLVRRPGGLGVLVAYLADPATPHWERVQLNGY